MSSGYDNVVGGKLKLKGKALDVKANGGIRKKKKKTVIPDIVQSVKAVDSVDSAGGSTSVDDPLLIASADDDLVQKEETDPSKQAGESGPPKWDEHLTPAERRYMEQRERIDMHKLAKTANKSHRDRIEDFNQYLANMSEHYDIPKVGPG